MAHRHATMEQIEAARVVAVIRSGDCDEAVRRAAVLIDNGVDVVEVALTTPGAAEAISTIRQRHPHALVGAGTVLEEASARMAIMAGARFLLSPCLSLPVIRTGHRYGIAVVPGVQTPTEMISALEAGADAVKLFPASTFGPAYLKATLAALPQLAVVPTGGIATDELPGWLDAGAVAVGIGGALTGGPLEQTAARASELVQLVRTMRA